MSRNSKIEWTGKTWNPCVGCTKISTGCKHCYAETAAASPRLQQFPRYQKVITNGKWNGETCLVESVLEKPLHWKQPQIIFVNSMGDMFHPTIPFTWIDKILAISVLCQQHTFQILTKYSSRMAEYFSLNFANRIECIFCEAHSMLLAKYNGDIPENIETAFNDLWEVEPLKNVWLGVTVEHQDLADARILDLLKCPSVIKFISVEPMLSNVNIKQYLSLRMRCIGDNCCGYTGPSYEFVNTKKDGAYACPGCNKNHSYLITESINWVICGGESGKGARLIYPDWARRLLLQCKAAGVPFFMKQMGGYPDKRGKLIDIPEDLRVREMPEVRVDR